MTNIPPFLPILPSPSTHKPLMSIPQVLPKSKEYALQLRGVRGWTYFWVSYCFHLCSPTTLSLGLRQYSRAHLGGSTSIPTMDGLRIPGIFKWGLFNINLDDYIMEELVLPRILYDIFDASIQNNQYSLQQTKVRNSHGTIFSTDIYFIWTCFG